MTGRERMRLKRKNDPVYAERQRQIKRQRYADSFAYREDSKLRSYMTKCRQNGRLNNE